MEKTKRVLFPYGISNFEQVITGGYEFVDRTPFLELLEESGETLVVFLRPRRFGKSLFLSVLEYYYDTEKKEKFDTIFSKYYIGKNPTKLANSFRILKFDFSGIDTKTTESTYNSFAVSVKNTVGGFCKRNGNAFNDLLLKIDAINAPEGIIDTLFEFYPPNEPPIYLFIDEYDHFTNEILLRNLSEFKTSVSQNGYVRKFYEVIKTATQSGVVNRFFITGVSPVTLDSLTSGFNITTNLTLERDYNELMGFTENEVNELLIKILSNEKSLENTLENMRTFYNGYRFSPDAEVKVYNPDMVLYFLKHFAKENQYPREMLDPNIAPDYGKLKLIFERLNWFDNTFVLNEVLSKDEISSVLIRQFNFETDDWGSETFVSFLFYMGNLTIKGENELGEILFKIPNKVIEDLYWQFYASLLKKEKELTLSKDLVVPSVRAMALGNHEAFFDLIRAALKELSNRDFQKFDEKYVKLLVIAYAVQSEIFLVQSERETKDGGYIDLEFSIQPRNRQKPHFEYVFEFKYLKKEDEKDFDNLQKAAEKQLKHYLASDEILKNKPKLRAFTAVVVKDELFLKEINK